MSGLPVNTKAQAQEYRKQYLAYLALEAQNDAYNMMANQVYKQTGQPSRPPDTRTTTEKLGDLEQLRVSLLTDLKAITDGQMAMETVADLTNDEIAFVSQMLPSIIADLKPKFARGVPSQALLSYIRALRRKELATSGVSFTAQESTAQSILNALMAGRAVGAPLPPFAPPAPAEPVAPPVERRVPTPPALPARPSAPSFMEELRARSLQRASEQVTEPITMVSVPGESTGETVVLAAPAPTPRRLSPLEEAVIQRAREMGIQAEDVASRGQAIDLAELIERRGTNEPIDTRIQFSTKGEFMRLSYPKIRKWFEDWKYEIPGLSSLVPPELLVTRGVDTGKLKFSPPGGVPAARESLMAAAAFYIQHLLEQSTIQEMPVSMGIETQVPSQLVGFGMKPRGLEPHSRFPTGRHILGYGLSKPKAKKTVTIDMTQGLINSAPTFVPFGKYIINPSKLSRGIIEIKTMNGGKLSRYPEKRLSQNLTKIMRRMLEDRMPDEYDFNEMDMEDQNYLFNLAKDAKINERLNIPTPKLTKDGEEQNRFEILKGQIQAGNDNREMVKEFKQLLLKFSDDGRIKKSEAREILLDLTALGY
jgi:hypothetical protein